MFVSQFCFLQFQNHYTPLHICGGILKSVMEWKNVMMLSGMKGRKEEKKGRTFILIFAGTSLHPLHHSFTNVGLIVLWCHDQAAVSSQNCPLTANGILVSWWNYKICLMHLKIRPALSLRLSTLAFVRKHFTPWTTGLGTLFDRRHRTHLRLMIGDMMEIFFVPPAHLLTPFPSALIHWNI